MENRSCSALVDGKDCGLEVTLIHQDIDTETEVFECPLGHRKYIPLGETEKRKCSALSDGKDGLALSVVQRDHDTATEIYECPLGHRSYVPSNRKLLKIRTRDLARARRPNSHGPRQLVCLKPRTRADHRIPLSNLKTAASLPVLATPFA